MNQNIIKVVIYIIVSALTIYSLDSVNINAIFKKNKPIQAKIFYFLLAMALIYLVTNFVNDLIINTKIF